MRKKKKIEVPRRTKRLDSRATPEEYNTVKESAKRCGLTISDYMRKCALGHKKPIVVWLMQEAILYIFVVRLRVSLRSR